MSEEGSDQEYQQAFDPNSESKEAPFDASPTAMSPYLRRN
jgi:hypothetical protein